MKQTRISFNLHSRTSLAHVIFLDQPRGTGFSDSDADGFWTHEESAQDMATFLIQFFLKHAELATNDFYIFGESYGGQYVPDLAQHLLRTDAARWRPFLKGIGIGNGVVSPRSIVDIRQGPPRGQLKRNYESWQSSLSRRPSVAILPTVHFPSSHYAAIQSVHTCTTEDPGGGLALRKLNNTAKPKNPARRTTLAHEHLPIYAEAMPETPSKEENYHPSIVGNTFMRQYYQLLAKEPQSLHRFYKDESRWSHTNGSQMQEPIAGQKAINEQILKRGYAGARVDLDIGSIDCQASHSGGVFVLVTGVMTLVDSIVPKPFVQTFFLATQPKGYFVLNDCLRFLELPGASPASLAAAESAAAAAPAAAVNEVKKPQAAIGTPVAQSPAAKAAKVPASPVKTTAPAVAVSMPVAKKEKTPASPAAKPASPAPAAAPAAVATPLSPVKVKTPVVQSPVKTAAPKSAPRDASPVKKAAAAPAAADKPAPAAIGSPKASPAAAAPAVLSPTAAAKPVKAAEPKPAPVPAAPTSWASLFSAAVTPSAPASTGAAKAAPALAAVATAAVAANAPPAKPAPAASPKATKSASGDAAGAPKEKEKTRYHSVYIKEVPAQTKESDLRDLFKGFGAIANVNVVGTRGYAFVDFYEQESMRAALAESNDFKLFDKTLIVDERTDRKDQRSGFRGDATSRGGRSGGRGPGPKGRTGGDRKERDESKGERRAAGENGASGNSNAGRGSNGSAPPRSDRREKSGRRGGKVESGSARTE